MSESGQRLVLYLAPGSRILWTLGLWTLATSFFCGCTVPSSVPPRIRPAYTAPDYDSRTPIQVAVLKPSATSDLSEDERISFRECLVKELIGKGYSPLNPSYVDERANSVKVLSDKELPRVSALRQAMEADAYLLTEILSIQEIPGIRPPVLRIETRSTLLEAAAGTTLFEYRLSMTFEAPFDSEGHLSSRARQDLIKRYSTSLLSPLPGRRS